MNDYYFQIKVILGKKDSISYADLIQCSRVDYNCDGIEEFSIGEAGVDNILGERAYSGGKIPSDILDEVEKVVASSGPQSVLFLFCSESAEKDAQTFQRFLQVNNIGHKFFKRDVRDWNKEWKEHYGTIEISKALKIVPAWEKKENKKNEIYIDPGMGFGTGEHETTYLCLEHFEKLLQRGKIFKTCLDFGCGSGILGIAGMKRAHMRVDFCDIDTDALDNCRQNLLLNFEGEDLAGNTLVSRERYRGGKKYDLVFANILQNVLVEEASVLLKALGVNGYLILSGILIEQIPAIKNKYSFLHIVETAKKGPWASIVLQARG